MTKRELLKEGVLRLEQAGIVDADWDAWYLYEFVTGENRTGFFMKSGEEATEEMCLQFFEMIQKRAEHVPVQYLTGTADFCGFSFKVDENVLIPRQDTEVLVERVLKERKTGSVLDMCTGSGCILLSLMKMGQFTKGVGVDLSEGAVQVARENAAALQVEVQFVVSDLFQKIPKETYDVIVSNPPYIRKEVIEGLDPEVRDHEPYSALYGPEDGLYFYRKIAAEARGYLAEGGLLCFEIGFDQGEDVRRIMESEGYRNVQVGKDLAGLDRNVWGNCPVGGKDV